MSRVFTNRDMQRATFVESLYSSLKKQAKQALSDQQKFIKIASSYISDGLEDNECLELLMIDGLSREAAEGYLNVAKTNNTDIDMENDNPEYSFQFEDEGGSVFTSHDIGKAVQASSDDDAWKKAEETLDTTFPYHARVISVTRIN
jgi:hypothetical protein